MGTETKLPGHIAVIMDGNGRWAKKRLFARKAGHAAGANNLRTLADEMNKRGFKLLTVYAFSTENWKRSEEEVRDLMNILRDFFRKYLSDVKKNNIRLNVIGDITPLDDDLKAIISELETLSGKNTGLCVNIALNYGGRDEIRRAACKMCFDAAAGKLNPADVTEQLFETYLDTAGFPDPDILIRTGGERRVSNYLLWQCAYSEFFFTDTLWPDFKISDMMKIVDEFSGRDRRFGGRNS